VPLPWDISRQLAEYHQKLQKRSVYWKNKYRKEIYERDGWACLRCKSKDRLSMDHIVALCRGGDNSQGNFQTLCITCNTKKASTDRLNSTERMAAAGRILG
jgi:5-methylcytosine-specific restriction endonuclease McrA